jgi:hypothetical protein
LPDFKGLAGNVSVVTQILTLWKVGKRCSRIEARSAPHRSA